MGRGRPKKSYSRDCVIKVRLTGKELGRLRALAEERDMSLSAMIRYLINSFWEA